MSKTLTIRHRPWSQSAAARCGQSRSVAKACDRSVILVSMGITRPMVKSQFNQSFIIKRLAAAWEANLTRNVWYFRVTCDIFVWPLYGGMGIFFFKLLENVLVFKLSKTVLTYKDFWRGWTKEQWLILNSYSKLQIFSVFSTEFYGEGKCCCTMSVWVIAAVVVKPHHQKALIDITRRELHYCLCLTPIGI